MGLMAAFMASVATASKRAGQVFSSFLEGAGAQFDAAKRVVREYRLFAKTKAARLQVMGRMMRVVGAVQRLLGRAVKAASSLRSRVTKYGKVARAKLLGLHATMTRLLPQIHYWHRTGRVAKKKVISLHLPELYAIVRGKIAKPVEFGLAWGFARLRGGFLLATLGANRQDVVDSRFAVRAVDDCKALFGKAPRAYAYDRAGYSKENVAALKEKGVKQVGLAPLGRLRWEVNAKVRDRLVHERALIEAGIGTVKCPR
jgi:hypothetical protein